MTTLRLVVALLLVGAVALSTTPVPVADAQGQTIKIGILYDHSGPFSAAGSLNCYRGAKMIIDYIIRDVIAACRTGHRRPQIFLPRTP